LLGDGLRRRWEPDVRDARGRDVIHLAHQEVVPPAILLPRLPVETLSLRDAARAFKIQSKTHDHVFTVQMIHSRQDRTWNRTCPDAKLDERPRRTRNRDKDKCLLAMFFCTRCCSSSCALEEDDGDWWVQLVCLARYL
jgi:hypothetical protein